VADFGAIVVPVLSIDAGAKEMPPEQTRKRGGFCLGAGWRAWVERRIERPAAMARAVRLAPRGGGGLVQAFSGTVHGLAPFVTVA
jgi:hypothetical protein